MSYNAEYAAVRMAVKRTRKAGTVEAGFSSLHKWAEKFPEYDLENVFKCFKKWIKHEFYK